MPRAGRPFAVGSRRISDVLLLEGTTRAVPQRFSHSDHHASLHAVADSLGHAVADNGGALLVHVIQTPGGPDVGILPLDGLAPADALLGVVAPDHWAAVGVASMGWARSLDRPAGRGVRTEVVVLVARDGHVVGRVRHGGEVLTEPPASGLVLDGLQRALGLPTAPPDVRVADFVAMAWLEGVVAAGRAHRQPPPLSEIGTLLPALAEGGLDWSRLRALVIDGRWQEPGLTPTDAAWFDDGAFSRWVISGRPSLAALLSELRRVVGHTEARRYAQKLRSLGVQTAA
jgi:hypothetical protein